MKVKPDRERLKNVITDTISLLCKSSLKYIKELKIEGLLGITLDDDEVFLVSVKEIFPVVLENAVVDCTDDNGEDSNEVSSQSRCNESFSMQSRKKNTKFVGAKKQMTSFRAAPSSFSSTHSRENKMDKSLPSDNSMNTRQSDAQGVGDAEHLNQKAASLYNDDKSSFSKVSFNKRVKLETDSDVIVVEEVKSEISNEVSGPANEFGDEDTSLILSAIDAGDSLAFNSNYYSAESQSRPIDDSNLADHYREEYNVFNSGCNSLAVSSSRKRLRNDVVSHQVEQISNSELEQQGYSSIDQKTLDSNQGENNGGRLPLREFRGSRLIGTGFNIMNLRRRKYRNYSSEAMSSAFNDVLSGTLNINDASRHYSVPLQTLRDRINRHLARNNSSDNSNQSVQKT